jgi:hypothetical protein
MDSYRRNSSRNRSSLLRCCSFLGALVAVGCASPGPPRAPSLNLPEPTRDLAATRTGNAVELHFTPPARSTDKLPLPGATTIGQICRQLEGQPCIPVPTSRTTVATTGPDSAHVPVTWTDTLPPALLQGTPRLLAYRVEFFSPSGRSAGPSIPAFTVTGPPLLPVDNLHAEGSREGVVLTWTRSSQSGEVLLKREDLEPNRPKAPPQRKRTSRIAPPIVWLGTNAASDSSSPQPRSLDTTALPNIPYRYVAQRRASIQLGNRSIELFSDLSAPILFTLREVYPPPAPTGLTAVGFFGTAALPDVPPTFAVDLIWQPVDDAGLTTGLAGYNIYRERMETTSTSTIEPPHPLNSAPLPTPAFHDTSANPAMPYRYRVTAVDAKGNESPATTVLLTPSSKR